ncbi:uncharacterized protein LOC142628594 [Castanea sativa]|uniref:uncharacterized protein LOC142628594 n=1 Tax=Castanea sativa TaxID=21020 RepID=UPI003F64EEDC
MVGDYPQQITKDVTFLVVDCSSAYNAILGRLTLNSWKALTSTYHLMLKFPTENGVRELRGDQIAARECYIAILEIHDHLPAMCIEERRAAAESVEGIKEVPLDDTKPERTTKIGTLASLSVRQDIKSFLRDNQDVFAWSHEDIPGIDPSVICVFAQERDRAIVEEVRKLQEARFIREVYYPDWLANIVMVKKTNGKWRMCVDFTDLNRVCPKDSYPLPRIDVLVDSSARHQLLSLMDAFSGYNQIKLDEADQEKTSFITSQGLFYYKVMSFGLKNAGATYQRLMNRMFAHQIGRNVEVYVDDMLIKSVREDDHLNDLRETFEMLRLYNMKLNPRKCMFRVTTGKFLGFMVIQRDIEVSPDKVRAIMELAPPKTIKEEAEGNYQWMIYTDGSAIKHTGGAGIVLFTPEGDEVQCMIRLNFPVTNNEAEYEALIARLDLARAAGATSAMVHCDSRVVTSQNTSCCECRGEWMKEYLEQVKRRMHNMNVEFVQIPREENEQAFLDLPRQHQQITCLPRAKYSSLFAHNKRSQRARDRNRGKLDNTDHLLPEGWIVDLYGIPMVLVSDNKKQSDNDAFRDFCSQLRIKNHYSSPSHPQANGQVEVTNRTLLKIIKTRLEEAKEIWPEELPSVLWAYRTTVRTPTRETPFRQRGSHSS